MSSLSTSFLRKRRTKRSGGFTLIESMLSLAVFTIGFTGLVAYQIQTTMGASKARNLAIATNLADSVNQLITLIPPSYNTPSTAQSFSAYFDRTGAYLGTASNGNTFFSVTTTVTAADTMNLRDTSTTIQWKNAGDTNPSALLLHGKIQ